MTTSSYDASIDHPSVVPVATFCAILLVAASLSYAPLSAQEINGVLLESGTNRPVDLGLITLFTVDGDSVATVMTDGDGRFRVASSQAGEFLLSASALGYVPTLAGSVFTLAEGGRMSLEFRIQPQPIEIGGITVETAGLLIHQPKLVQNGFVQRAQRGFGRFITPSDIEGSHSTGTVDLLARTGRVESRYAFGGNRILMRATRGLCTPTVYLDDVRISLDGISLDAIAPLIVLQAAEVYRSANEAPMRYAGGMGGCGIIVLWTR